MPRNISQAASPCTPRGSWLGGPSSHIFYPLPKEPSSTGLVSQEEPLGIGTLCLGQGGLQQQVKTGDNRRQTGGAAPLPESCALAKELQVAACGWGSWERPENPSWSRQGGARQTRSRGKWGLTGGTIPSTGRFPKGLKVEAVPTVFGEAGDGKAQSGCPVLPGESVDCAMGPECRPRPGLAC